MLVHNVFRYSSPSLPSHTPPTLTNPLPLPICWSCQCLFSFKGGISHFSASIGRILIGSSSAGWVRTTSRLFSGLWMLQFLSFCTFENVIMLHFNDISIGSHCHSSTLPAAFRQVTPLRSSHSADFTVSARGGYLHVSKPVLVIPFVAAGKELTKARTEDSQFKSPSQRRAWQQEHEAADHNVPTVRNRDGCWGCSAHLLLFMQPAHGRGCTQLGWDFPPELALSRNPVTDTPQWLSPLFSHSGSCQVSHQY